MISGSPVGQLGDFENTVIPNISAKNLDPPSVAETFLIFGSRTRPNSVEAVGIIRWNRGSCRFVTPVTSRRDLMLVDVNSSNFDACLMTEGIALVDCWAPWCAACREFTPTFEAAAERHPSHTFAKLDTHEQSDLAKKLKVSHIPTIILFRDGLLLLRQPGYLSHEEIDEVIAKAEGLDMKHVRTDMEKRLTGETT